MKICPHAPEILHIIFEDNIIIYTWALQLVWQIRMEKITSWCHLYSSLIIIWDLTMMYWASGLVNGNEMYIQYWWGRFQSWNPIILMTRLGKKTTLNWLWGKRLWNSLG